MNPWLLDVNVLVARFWEPHVFHERVRKWFNSHQHEGWATCPITQLGLVRTLSNPAFDEHAPRPTEALHWLAQTLKDNPHHHFWPDSLPAFAACSDTTGALQGFRQLTDAYLLGLAMQHKAKFITLDKRILAIAPEQSQVRRHLVILE